MTRGSAKDERFDLKILVTATWHEAIKKPLLHLYIQQNERETVSHTKESIERKKGELRKDCVPDEGPFCFLI